MITVIKHHHKILGRFLTHSPLGETNMFRFFIMFFCFYSTFLLVMVTGTHPLAAAVPDTDIIVGW